MAKNIIRANQYVETSRFDALIAEAYASGGPTPLTNADIHETRRVVKERIKARNSAK